ncbi:MAG: hypothetical protein KF689_05690 [Gemmatimonadaceae bacterium]|nr:hypothetical protein [Gemmatimonadaceae bacterium]MCW5825334.1 hypothetical protein [Gemmatimonadaceae bacterium]
MRAATRLRAFLATLALPLVAACVDLTGPSTVIVDEGPDCRARWVQRPSTTHAALTAWDCTTDDGTQSYVDYYELRVYHTTWVDFYMESYDFDAYLMLFDEWDVLVADDDDGGEATDSWLTVKLVPGTYYVGATSFRAGERGAYSLYIE